MSQPLGVLPFPFAEIGGASSQELIRESDVVVDVFAVSQIHTADRVATAQ